MLQVFARVRAVANADTVQKVGATYLFDVEGAGEQQRWRLALKTTGR